jgi:hypothetical protein
MLNAASSKAEKKRSSETTNHPVVAPPGFDKADGKRPAGDAQENGASPDKENGTHRSGNACDGDGPGDDVLSSTAPAKSQRPPRSAVSRSGEKKTKPNGSSERVKRVRARELEIDTGSLLETTRALPKRQLWVVRVPPPPAEDDATAAAIEQKEKRVLHLTKTIDTAMEKLAAAKLARDEARVAVVPVRDQLREVNDELREKHAQMKPLQDVVAASDAASNEVKSLGRDLRGVSTEEALQSRLDELDRQMSHEPLSVLEQKAVLREMSKLKERRGEISIFQGKKKRVEENSFHRETATSRLKLMRSLVEFIKLKQAEVKKLFDHYKSVADAADDAARKANEVRANAANERRELTAELRALKKVGSRDRSEFYRSRRVAGKARDLVKRGDFAEAEALCLEHMEHVHARLAMDSEYRVEYVEGLARQRRERSAAKEREGALVAEKDAADVAEAPAAEAAEAPAAEAAEAPAAKAAEAAAAKAAEAAAAKAAKESARQAAKDMAKVAALEAKKREAEAALAAMELEEKAKAEEKASTIAEAPVFDAGPLAANEAKRVDDREEAQRQLRETEDSVGRDSRASQAEREDAKRKKRAEKKARKKEKNREKYKASASGSGSVSEVVSSVATTETDEASGDAVEPVTEPVTVSEAVSEAVSESVSESVSETVSLPASASLPTRSERASSETKLRGGKISVSGKNVFGVTDEQMSWIAVAIALVAMCVLAIAGAIGGVRV